jgi:hypothetical protein
MPCLGFFYNTLFVETEMDMIDAFGIMAITLENVVHINENGLMKKLCLRILKMT